MIIAMFRDPADAESALTNLSEADIAKTAISLIAKDPSIAQKLGHTHGPLSALLPAAIAQHLVTLGLDLGSATQIQAMVAMGDILMAVNADTKSANAIAEILADANGEHLFTLPDTDE